MNENILKAMQWRYATKSFDPTKQVSEHDLNTIIEAMRLTPSAYGLQPWKFFIIESKELRTKLADSTPNNRVKIETASHLMVIARHKDMQQSYIDNYANFMCEQRKQKPEDVAPFRNMVSGKFAAMSEQAISSWAARQTYIPLGSALMTAALLGIDTCAMEGLDPAKFDNILGLEDSDYTTVVSLAIGYRSELDTFAEQSKVRLPIEEVVEVL